MCGNAQRRLHGDGPPWLCGGASAKAVGTCSVSLASNLPLTVPRGPMVPTRQDAQGCSRVKGGSRRSSHCTTAILARAARIVQPMEEIVEHHLLSPLIRAEE